MAHLRHVGPVTEMTGGNTSYSLPRCWMASAAVMTLGSTADTQRNGFSNPWLLTCRTLEPLMDWAVLPNRMATQMDIVFKIDGASRFSPEHTRIRLANGPFEMCSENEAAPIGCPRQFWRLILISSRRGQNKVIYLSPITRHIISHIEGIGLLKVADK